MTDPLPNPERGCGHLETGKTYIRGVTASYGGVLPSFVRANPPIPYREIGTNGGMTRSFECIDGLSLQLALGESHTFEPLTANGGYGEQAFENMVESMGYDTRMEIPQYEVDRHIDRIRERSGQLCPESYPDTDWGRMGVTDQTDLLMRAGKSHYPDPDDFIEEARVHGLSKAIPTSSTREPPTVLPGITRCWVMCPNAGANDYGGAVVGYTYIGQIVFTEPDDGQVPAYIEEYEEQDKLDVRPVADPSDGPATEQKNQTLPEAANTPASDDD